MLTVISGRSAIRDEPLQRTAITEPVQRRLFLGITPVSNTRPLVHVRAMQASTLSEAGANGIAAVAKQKPALPTWIDIRSALSGFDRAGLLGLVQDLYAASKDNQAFLHARLGLGEDQLTPYKARISRWISPDFMRNERISVSKAKKAISDYKKAIGRPEGMAELSIFYCEEALGFLESCSMEDEGYFVALIRMYYRCLKLVLNLPTADRASCIERLDKLRPRAAVLGWGVQDELNEAWFEADLNGSR